MLYIRVSTRAIDALPGTLKPQLVEKLARTGHYKADRGHWRDIQVALNERAAGCGPNRKRLRASLKRASATIAKARA